MLFANSAIYISGRVNKLYTEINLSPITSRGPIISTGTLHDAYITLKQIAVQEGKVTMDSISIEFVYSLPWRFCPNALSKQVHLREFCVIMKGKQLCEFLFAFLNNKTLSKSWGLLLEERICSYRIKLFPMRDGPIEKAVKTENTGVASPESVHVYLTSFNGKHTGSS